MEPQYTKTNVLLTAKDINLSFGNKVILSNINFQIKNIIVPGRTQGQVVALVGISGKGKCVTSDMEVTVRNKNTGIIEKVKIKELIRLILYPEIPTNTI